MSYHDTIDYLYSRLPLFSRIGPAAIKADLHNTIAICDLLGNPKINSKQYILQAPMEKAPLVICWHPYYKKQDTKPDYILPHICMILESASK